MRSAWLALLGLPSTGATPEEIKQAYRRVAKQHHPDVSSSPSSSERFRQATEACEGLLEASSSDEEASSARHDMGPAMAARWAARRRHTPSEYPAWFNPSGGRQGTGERGLHTVPGSGSSRVRLRVSDSERLAPLGARAAMTLLRRFK